jgi:hypothetical protein
MSPCGLGDIDANQGAHFNRNERPLLALSGLAKAADQCPLIGAKQTSQIETVMSADDPQQKPPPAFA